MKPWLAGGGSGASRTDGADDGGGVIDPEDPAEKRKRIRMQQTRSDEPKQALQQAPKHPVW